MTRPGRKTAKMPLAQGFCVHTFGAEKPFTLFFPFFFMALCGFSRHKFMKFTVRKMRKNIILYKNVSL